jgi:hypothetical protein
MFVSTFGGETGVFYESATDPDNPRLLTLDWKDNPTQTKNAYVVRDGKAMAVRPDEQSAVDKYAKSHASQMKKLDRRGHVLEGKFRSPWYDAYCLLPGATPRFVARELDMDPRGASGKVFAVDVLDRMKIEHCRPPVWQGKPVFEGETHELKGLIRQKDGPLSLWFEPGLDNAPPRGRYAIGCDISAGGTSKGSSNSVAHGVDVGSGRQVMEYAIHGMKPTTFGHQCVALAKWLNAYLGWEATGPGSLFEEAVVTDCDYWNIYWRDSEEVGTGAKTKKAGWWNGSNDAKQKLLENLELAMQDGDFIPRSEDLIRECGEYEWVDGKIVHKPSKQDGIDEKQHGDRCIAAGVAQLLCTDRPISRLDKNPEDVQTVQYGTMAYRLQQRERKSSDREENDLAGFECMKTGAW